jgi:hypothetical protein
MNVCGRIEAQRQALLTLAWDRSEWSALQSGRFILGKGSQGSD